MKIIRYEDSMGLVHYGAVQADGTACRIAGDVFGEYELTADPARIQRLLAPVAPVQILGIGLNYRRHAQEVNMAFPQQPIIFMKGVNSLQHPDAPIEIPVAMASTEVDYEAELAVVIGRDCRNVTRENALDYVLGYTCANDVSARDWQLKRGGGQWTRGKMFDTFSPLGPVLVTRDEIPNPNDLRISATLNGEVVQDWNTNDMIFDIPEIISFLSGSTTLPAGTVIVTGTPHGVGMSAKPPRWLKAGDSITIEIEKIGRLTNPVVNERV